MVTIYTVPGCSKCALLKRKAQEYGIEYEESQDVDALIAAGYRQAPILKVDDKYYVFKDALQYLEHAGDWDGNNVKS